jgi:hypothetical protein
MSHIEYELQGSVGNGGKNMAIDIIKVQTLLAIVLSEEKKIPGWGLALGQDSAELRREISAFQTSKTRYRDGRIDPGGVTWRALLSESMRILRGQPLPNLPKLPNPQPTPSPTKSNFLQPIENVAWAHRDWSDLPLLIQPESLSWKWSIDFGSPPFRRMRSLGFSTPRGSHIKYVGFSIPEGCTRPDAYLIYFRHTAQIQDFSGESSLLTLGVGDHIEGRFQLPAQVAASGKNIGVVMPSGYFHMGEFTNSDSFIEKCLHSIEDYLDSGRTELPPLVLACYSDGIGELSKFMMNCPRMRQRVIAIYDLDGAMVLRFRHLGLAYKGVRTFRYVGTPHHARIHNEHESAYLQRTMNINPAYIPLPRSRWSSYPVRAQLSSNEYWLHFFIPTCMLTHGLAMTTAI